MILKKTIKKKLSQDLTIEQVNTIEGELISGKTLTEIFSEKNPYQVSLQKFYAMLKRNKELEIKIIEARKMGMQTLIDKIMTLLQTEEITDPNLITPPASNVPAVTAPVNLRKLPMVFFSF